MEILFMESAFHTFIKRFGRYVLITTRTPTLDGEGNEITDTDGQLVYTETENSTKARINVLQGSERIIENMILKPGDAIGLFKNADIEYLNTDSYVDIDYLNGVSFHFKIKEILPKITHLKVLMKRVE